MKTRWLTANEVARICDVTPRTVRNWVNGSQQDPCRRVKRDNRHYFNPQTLAQWLQRHGKLAEASRVRGFIASLEPARPKPAPREEVTRQIQTFERQRSRPAEPPEADAGENRRTGTESATAWDIFRVRATTARMYAEGLRLFIRASAEEKPLHQKNVNATADLMRKLELDCITVAKQMGLVIHMADSVQVFRDCAARVKRDLMLVPHDVAEDLAAMTDPREIERYLTDRINDTLRHLAEGPQRLGAPEDNADSDPSPGLPQSGSPERQNP